MLEFQKNASFPEMRKNVGISQYKDGIRVDKKFHSIFNPINTEFHVERGSSRPIKIIFNGKVFDANYRYEGQTDQTIELHRIGFNKALCDEFQKVFPTPQGSIKISVGIDLNHFIIDICTDSTDWSDDELAFAIKLYLEMLELERSQQNYRKTDFFKQFCTKFERTPKSIEYRMQNISYVLNEMGLSWVAGLKPAKNVGKNIFNRIQALLTELPRLKEEIINVTADDDVLQTRVQYILDKVDLKEPPKAVNPTKSTTTSDVFARSPLIKAWVLKQANGICELCKQPAPFINKSGWPYLEVHHVVSLANGGDDSVENTVALCPNCHRALHHSEQSHELLVKLRVSVGRLLEVEQTRICSG
jgi:5-methylcytosine-specific restriction protein A